MFGSVGYETTTGLNVVRAKNVVARNTIAQIDDVKHHLHGI